MTECHHYRRVCALTAIPMNLALRHCVQGAVLVTLLNAHRHPSHILQLIRVYRVPNLHSDRNAEEPGAMACQPEHILMRSAGTPSHCPSGSVPMHFTNTGTGTCTLSAVRPDQSQAHILNPSDSTPSQLWKSNFTPKCMSVWRCTCLYENLYA